MNKNAVAVEELRERIRQGEFVNRRPWPQTEDFGTDEAANEMRQAYLDEHHRLRAAFKAQALKAVGLADHLKANKAYQFAWEFVHEAGTEAVLDLLVRLAALMVHDDFKDEALKAVGLAGHPKADEAYQLAWEMDPEGSNQDVLGILARLADLMG